MRGVTNLEKIRPIGQTGEYPLNMKMLKTHSVLNLLRIVLDLVINIKEYD